MDAQREQRVESLFQQTVDLPTDQRDSYLHAHCDDADILRRVETLLRHHAEAQGNFLTGLTEPPPVEDPPVKTDPPGRDGTIAHYRLIRVIGEGGMGIVYEAEEDRPKRKVALKVIRRGFATPAMLRRFEYEADVLARLDHPGIARIHHAGIADSGQGPQPYFAMELLQGVRLDQWIEQHKPTTTQRLKLLIEMCDAVHHAHTKGVIHRDLKPSNILITSEARPKILDFGVARATDSDIQSTTLHTESGAIIGTLPYMAPEQASGKVNDLDTSSDVYALGVIAYELLSGTMPYSLEGKALHEAVRVICEQEPSRLSSVNRSLRGDVETIVQKALEKDKTRRYHTAGEFGADVKRFLDYEPITARPPGTWYQLAKFARRNKLLVGATATLLVVLGAGVLGTTIGLVRTQRQRAEAVRQKQQAEDRKDQAEAVVKFLTDDVFHGATPERMPDAKVRDQIVRIMLDPAAKSMALRFAGKPTVEAAVRSSLAACYARLGRANLAIPHAESALKVIRDTYGDDSAEAISAMDNLAAVLDDTGKVAEAEALYREALDRSRRVLGSKHEETQRLQSNLGKLLRDHGRSAEAEPLWRDALQYANEVFGENDPVTIGLLNNLSVLLYTKGQFAEAEPLARDALKRGRLALGDDHPDTINMINNLAALLVDKHELADGGNLYTEGLERSRRVMGEDHPLTQRMRNNLGAVLLRQEKYVELEPVVRETWERSARAVGENHFMTLTYRSNLGTVLVKQGKLEEAEAVTRDAADRCRKAYGEDNATTLMNTATLAQVLQLQGKLSEAESLQRQVLASIRKLYGDSGRLSLVIARDLGITLEKAGKLDEAAELFRIMHDSAASSEQPASDAAALRSYYGPLLVRMKHYDAAEEPLQKAYEALVAAKLDRAKQARRVIEACLELSEHRGKTDESAVWRARLAALPASTQPTTQPTTGSAEPAQK